MHNLIYVASPSCDIPSNVILLRMQNYISMYCGATAVFLMQYHIAPLVWFGAFASENNLADKQLLSSNVVLYQKNLK